MIYDKMKSYWDLMTGNKTPGTHISLTFFSVLCVGLNLFGGQEAQSVVCSVSIVKVTGLSLGLAAAFFLFLLH